MSPLLELNNSNEQSYGTAFLYIQSLTMEECMSENSKIVLGSRAFENMSNVYIVDSPGFASWYYDRYGTTAPSNSP